jgi:ABC-type nitrate/sulfonate/bicarbonate transport system substrate-binding protein
VQKPEDLKDKKIAISSFGSVSDSMTRLVLRYWKIDPEKETAILPTGNTPTRIAALVTGRVDAGLVVAESLPKVLGSGCCRVLADLLDVPIDYALYGIVAPASLLRSQGNTARQFLEGIIEGISIFKSRQDIVLEVLREEGVKDAELAKQVYARLAKGLRAIPTAEPTAVQAILDSSLNPKVRNAKAEDFIDGKLLDEIKASGYVDRLYKR